MGSFVGRKRGDNTLGHNGVVAFRQTAGQLAQMTDFGGQ
jgi:hypothetical protein